MNWFLLACAAPGLWGITNYIDKILLSRLQKRGGGVSVLMLFSCLISCIAAPLIFIFAPHMTIEWSHASAVLFSVGVLYACGLWAYFYALHHDETSTVVPFFQLVPVWTYILGYLFLKETLTTVQLIASFAIMLGALTLTVDVKARHIRFRTFFFMMLCCILMGTGNVLFKTVSTPSTFWDMFFWEQIGLAVVGIVLFCVPRYRRDFLSVVRSNSARFFGVNIVNEMCTLIGNILQRFASLLAPVALVAVVTNAIQPLFVFTYGAILTLWFPHILRERTDKQHLIQKIVATVIMIIGTYFLSPFF